MAHWSLTYSEDNSNVYRWIIELLLVIALILSFFIPTGPAKADPGPKVPWEVDCDDPDPSNGFLDRGWCVPGRIKRSSNFIKSPGRFWGIGSSYSPGIMEYMCKRNGGCKGFKDGIAVMSCGDVGRTAWLYPIEKGKWYGPFKVVDCSQPHHMIVNVIEYGLAVEWGNKTAQEWGLYASSQVIVSFNGKPSDTWRGWYYRDWWMQNGMEFIQYDGIDWELKFAWRSGVFETSAAIAERRGKWISR